MKSKEGPPQSFHRHMANEIEFDVQPYNDFIQFTMYIQCQEIACMAFGISKSEPSTLFLSWIHVKEPFQRQRFGTRMMEFLAHYAAEHHARKIILDNVLEKENDFYEKMGFRYSSAHDNQMVIQTHSLLRSLGAPNRNLLK